MEETIESAVMGEFHYNESNRSFEINKNNWKLEEVEKIFSVWKSLINMLN